ncbi:CinA family nicotinamide mononucleotide deamidase-related protein [Gammaproteobacteria bacterium]|nr:CinA family nicotinamide mononucleotide deamidase-related protein [Gammaproteobacteria bacterium]
MKLEMICTGEEVLSGQIVDTNAAWFANTMMDHGIEMQYRITVGDRLNDLVAAFTERSKHADVILVNGGLGPTSDDLSAEAMALALQEELVENIPWREHLQAWFAKHNRVMPASNLKQCFLPASAILVDNPAGSAPGFRVKFNKAWLFFTPGVPVEFKQMVTDQFLPFISSEFSTTTATQLHKLLTLGHGESSLADKFEKLDIPAGITLGYRPSLPHLEIKLFARGEQAIQSLPDVLEKVKKILGTALVAENVPSIAEAVHTLLLDSGKTLSIAESCTGGMLTSQLIEFAGSSNYLQQGLVTYSNEAKHKVLQVSEETLQRYGAVSTETAHAMAQNCRQLLNSDYGLATTGIAGPDGGSEQKPVGMVVIALATANHTWIQTVKLSNRSRNLVRIMSSAIALDMLRRKILGEEPIVEYPSITRSDSSVINEQV